MPARRYFDPPSSAAPPAGPPSADRWPWTPPSSHEGNKSLRVEPGTSHGRLRALRARHPDHRQELRAERLGAHRRPRGARSGPLADRHRRGAHHGVHALRRPLGLAGRHAADWTRLSLRFVASRAQDQHPADRGQRRRVSRARRGSRASASMKCRPQDEWPAARSRPDLRPGVSLSRGRLDLSAHRRQALRARLPARLPDGARDSGVSGALRRRPRRQGRSAELERSYRTTRRRAVPARLRSRNSGRDARHRRRRLRCRREVAGPAAST